MNRHLATRLGRIGLVPFSPRTRVGVLPNYEPGLRAHCVARQVERVGRVGEWTEFDRVRGIAQALQIDAL